MSGAHLSFAASDGELSAAIDFVASLLENGVDGVAAFDDDLRCVYWGPVMERHTGVAAPGALGAFAADLVPALGGPDEARRMHGALGGACASSAAPLPLAEGGPAARFTVYYAPLHGEGGRIIGVTTVFRDRRAHRELVQQLGEADARFRRMADCAPVLLWMAGTDARCDFFNQTWLSFTGRRLEDEVGYGWAEGVHPEDFSHCIDTFMAAFNGRQSFEMTYRLRRADGEYRWVLDRGVPRYTPDGEFAGFIGSCIDITARKRVVDDLRRTAARLERANADLEQFAYIASHDLRAPLRAIDHLAALIEDDLAEGAELEEVARHLEMLHSRVERMDRLLEGLLTYARAGHRGVEPEPVDLGELVSDVARTLAESRQRPGVAVEIEGPLPRLSTARVPLEHVLANLLGNAVKHHDRDEGRVVVRAVDLGGAYEFSVADDGPGIPPALHAKAFQMFQTLQPRDRVEGSGLGLALVKRLVERSGGSVRLESPTLEGRGTTIRFTWPREWPRSA